jgi:hypothetical protein
MHLYGLWKYDFLPEGARKTTHKEVIPTIKQPAVDREEHPNQQEQE